MRKIFPLLLVLALCAPAMAAGEAKIPAPQKWSFQGPFGTYDRASLQRGFQVYREVCSACHGLTLLTFHDLIVPGGPSFREVQAKLIAAGFNVPTGPNAAGELLSFAHRARRSGGMIDILRKGRTQDLEL